MVVGLIVTSKLKDSVDTYHNRYYDEVLTLSLFRVINKIHYKRLKSLLDDGTVAFGG